MNILYILIVAMYMQWWCWSESRSHASLWSQFFNRPLRPSAHNFIKVSLLQVYVTINKFGIICLSETYLDSPVLYNDATSKHFMFSKTSWWHQGNSIGIFSITISHLPGRLQVIFKTIPLIQIRVVFASTLRTTFL